MTHGNTMTTKRKRRTSPILRLFPSLTDIAFVMPLAFIFAKQDGAKTLLSDGDTGWHIRTGDWILANGAAPRQDIFSFTMPGQEWFAWEWLWDALFAWLHSLGGLEAVVLASQLVICLTCALLYRLVQRRAGNVLIAIAVTLVAAAAMSIHWLARPHLFTLLFAVCLYGLCERTREDGRFARLAWAPVLMLPWVNLHGGFLVCFLLLGCYLAGEIAFALTTPSRVEARDARRAAGNWGLTLALCVAASFVNPYGWKLHQHIYAYLTESYHFRFISEFQSLSFQSPAAVYFEMLLVLAAGAVAWNLQRRRFAYVFLLAGWAHLALVSARNIPIFALFAAPLAAEALTEGLSHLRKAQLAKWIRSALGGLEDLARDMGRVDAPARLHLVSVAAFAMVALLVTAPDAAGKFRAEYDPKRYPDAALAALESLPAERVFTSDEWGDYLIYRRQGSPGVFIDGRSDFYGAEFGERYLDTMSVVPGWQSNLDRYEVDTILLSIKASLAGALKESAAWRVVYDDGVAVIFRRWGGSPGLRSVPTQPEALLGRLSRAENSFPPSGRSLARKAVF